MIQVKIKNVASQLYTHGAKFSSQEEAQAWISKHSRLNGPWGNPEHEAEILDENGLPFNPPQYETVPSEFEVETEDVTAEVEQAEINRQAIAFLSECDWKRQRHISQKALEIETSLSEEEYLQMEQEAQAARDSIV